MSGNQVGQRTSVGADISSLIAANPQDAGGKKGEYETAAGGMNPPGHDGEPTPSSEPPATAESTQTPVSNPQPDQGEHILGVPSREAEPVEQVPVAEETPSSGVDYDQIIAGLTGAAQSERKARQSVQEALEARTAELREAQAFRDQYGPHVNELAELWPQIREREVALEQAKQQQALLDRKLSLFKAAAAEAGLQVDDSAIDAQFGQQRMLSAMENLPNLIDQRLAHALDSRTSAFQQSEAQRAAEQAQAAAAKEKMTAASKVLDSFYAKHKGMEDFDHFIRPSIEADPLTDPATVAAPFLRLVASNAARSRAQNAGAVKVASGSETGQASAVSQQASGHEDLGAQFANMSLDEQFAKARQLGILK